MEASVVLSDEYFRRYIESTGLDRRITMASSNFREGSQTPGSLRDTALEIRHMFVSTPLPDSITSAILGDLDGLLGQETEIIVDFDPETVTGTTMHAGTPASILEAVRLGWSGYWTPESIRERTASGEEDYPRRTSVSVHTADSSGPANPGEELIREYESLLIRMGKIPRTGHPESGEIDQIIEAIRKIQSHSAALAKKA